MEHLLGNLLPNMAGPLILGGQLHIFTLTAWVLIILQENVEAHSGYDFPWSVFSALPFATGASFHDFHHSSNVGTYSSFINIWDTIYDSNKEYFATLLPDVSNIKKEK